MFNNVCNKTIVLMLDCQPNTKIRKIKMSNKYPQGPKNWNARKLVVLQYHTWQYCQSVSTVERYEICRYEQRNNALISVIYLTSLHKSFISLIKILLLYICRVFKRIWFVIILTNHSNMLSKNHISYRFMSLKKNNDW